MNQLAEEQLTTETTDPDIIGLGGRSLRRCNLLKDSSRCNKKIDKGTCPTSKEKCVGRLRVV